MEKSFAAGLLIATCSVMYLSAGSTEIAAVLFGFGLYAVCALELDLFTGKVGFLYKTAPKKLPPMLICNVAAAAVVGGLYPMPEDAVQSAVSFRLTLPLYAVLFRSVLCGVVMYVSVAAYKAGRKAAPILGVALFLRGGFLHCIADAAIMAMGVSVGACTIAQYAAHLCACAAGNAAGAIVFDRLTN